MDVVDLPLAGLKLLKPQVFRDERGYFLESYNQARLQKLGIDVTFVQDNHSRSSMGTVRGLHFQRASKNGPGQAKLLRVVSGRILDVAVDIRLGSSTFGQWAAVELDAENHHQLFVPVGFGHGFAVLSETADVLYKVSSLYDPTTECGFAFDDAAVGVPWPFSRETAVLSARDLNAKPLSGIMDLLSPLD